MAKRTIQGCRAIVTGASSGIGRALVQQLARRGAVLVITARRTGRLEELARQIRSQGSRAEIVAGDITDPDLRRQVVARAESAFGGLDLLVNNAGVGAMGLFRDAHPRRLRQVMEVNFFATVEMTRLALPLLQRGTRPMLVNVSSILGRRGAPYVSEYSAAKFAVHGFSEALRAELAPAGIDLLVVSPGTTDTEFFDRVLEPTAEPAWPDHAPVSPDLVARKTIDAIRRGRHEITPYFWGRILLTLNRIAPPLVDRLMARYVQPPRGHRPGAEKTAD